MAPNLLTCFEIQKFYENKPKFSSVYSRNNLSKIKDEAYVTNCDEYESLRIHWIAFCGNAKNKTYFVSFGVENILK